MSASTRTRYGAASGLKRLAAAIWWGDHFIARIGEGAGATARQPLDRYVNSVFQSLAVFRFVSFGLGAVLLFWLNPSDQRPFVLGTVVMLVGFYNVFRILWRFDPAKPRAMVQWVTLAVDVWLSISLILLSGGLDSPFLIYSLSPILTASLLMNLTGAVMVAGISVVFVSGVHVLARLGVNDLPWILSGNYLVLALLYSAICLLVVDLPFLANLSWQRRVRSESLASERQRLRREVHDSVAQTLAFLSLKMKLAGQRTSRGKSPITERDVAEIGSVIERTYLAVRDYLDGTDEESNDPLKV